MMLPVRACLLAAAMVLDAAHANDDTSTARDDVTPAAAICEDQREAPAWLDRMQAGLFRATCLTAVRFDRLFGSARFRDEYRATHGTIAAGPTWSERDQWSASARFRLQMQLPALHERLGVFVGKDNPDEYVSEVRDDLDGLPRQFGRPEDDAVLFGLGYSRPAPSAGDFDIGIGTTLESPPNPYVKGRYRLVLPFLEHGLLRLRETLFWQREDGAGATSRFDLDRLLAQGFLARWTGSATWAEHTDGVRWFSSVTVYQSLGASRALAYQLGASGETLGEVPLRDYGARVIFRRQFLRDWLFLELYTSVSWPRETLPEIRRRNLGCGAAVEMWFGERPPRT